MLSFFFIDISHQNIYVRGIDMAEHFEIFLRTPQDDEASDRDDVNSDSEESFSSGWQIGRG